MIKLGIIIRRRLKGGKNDFKHYSYSCGGWYSNSAGASKEKEKTGIVTATNRPLCRGGA
ncbi:MAG: hypothetical protein ABII20_06455 [Candidatus Omnitrophota bacterium]